MAMLSLLITLLILCLVLGLVWYVVTLLPLPAPFKNIALAIIAVIAAIYLLSILLGAAPLPVLR